MVILDQQLSLQDALLFLDLALCGISNTNSATLSSPIKGRRRNGGAFCMVFSESAALAFNPWRH